MWLPNTLDAIDRAIAKLEKPRNKSHQLVTSYINIGHVQLTFWLLIFIKYHTNIPICALNLKKNEPVVVHQ